MGKGRSGVYVQPAMTSPKYTTNEISVALARPDDADAIIAMARELAAAVDDPPPALERQTFIEDAFGAKSWFECFVARYRGEPAGFAIACRAFEAHTGRRRLWLGDLYVRREARKSGIGRALIAAVAKRGLELGCDAVYWELWRPNTAGRAFYDRLDAEVADDLAILRLTRERMEQLTG